MPEHRILTDEQLAELEALRVADALTLLRLVPAGQFQQGCVISDGDVLKDRVRALRHLPHALAELRAVRATLDRVRTLHSMDGHGPYWAGTEPMDGDAWCEAGCHLDDDGRCPTLAALDDEAIALKEGGDG